MLNHPRLFSNSMKNTRISEDQSLNDTTALPFTSSNFFGSTASLRPLLAGMTNLHRTESLTGLDKFPRTDLSSAIQSKDPPSMKSTTSTSFLFDNKSTPSGAMTFAFGESQSSSSVISSCLPTTPFTFSLTKPAITTTSTTPPKLFSTMMNPSKLSSGLLHTTPIFNQELAYLTCQTKTKVTIDRTRSKQAQLYSTTLPKSVKRKYDQALDDEDALFSTPPEILPKMNIKRPRMLDMKKIRSIVLGNTESYSLEKRESKLEESISIKTSDQRAFRLPRLTHRDYDTQPTIEELQSYFNEQGQCFVKEFTIIRKHYGSVTFQGLHMNLAGLDLDRLVRIDRRQVTIYPDETDRPDEGEELNCQAIISLIGVYPIDRSKCNSGEEVTDAQRLLDMNYGKYLEEMTKKFQGNFLDYDVHTGTWTFRVDHF